MSRVTDPSLLAQLEGVAPVAQKPTGRVSDPAVLAQLDGDDDGGGFAEAFARRFSGLPSRKVGSDAIPRTMMQNIGDKALSVRQGVRDVIGGGVGLPVDALNAVLNPAPMRLLNALGEKIGLPHAQTPLEVVGGPEYIPQPAAVDELRAANRAEGKADAAANQSARSRAMEKEYNLVDGFLPSVAHMLQNPDVLVEQGARQIPQLVAAVPGRVAATVGLQGALAGGQNEEQVVQALLEAGATPEQIAEAGANTSLASAALNTALPAIPGARTLERVMSGAGRKVATKDAGKHIVAALLGETTQGGAGEGLDQVVQNVATGRPWDEGVGKATATGALLEGSLGGAAAAVEAAASRKPSERKPRETINTAELDPEMLAEGAAALQQPKPTPAKTAPEAPQAAPEPEATTVAAPASVEAPTAAPEPERRAGDRRKFETADDAAVSAFTRRADDLALTPEQREGLAPKGAPRDRTTGLVDGRQGERESSIERAQAHVTETTEPAIYVAGDIANLGGLNDFFQNRQQDTDVHFKAMADIFQKELEATGADIVPMRTGGDELGAVVVGADQAAVDMAAERARSRIAKYAVENGLSDVPHPKGGQPGTGMHFGSSPIAAGVPVQDIINRADDGINISKRERKNVRGSTPEATGTGAPEGQAGSPATREQAPSQGVRRPSGQADTEGSTGRSTSLKNEVTDRERADAGRETILRDTTIENRATVDRARESLASDPKLGEKTATRLANSGEAGTLEDSGILLVDRMRLENERVELERVADDETASPQDRAQAILERDALEAKITANDLAAVSVGSEAARILQLRTRLLNQDYSVENLERRERIKKQRPLTAAERATIKQESERVLAATKAADVSDAKLEQVSTDAAVTTTLVNMMREILGSAPPKGKVGPLRARIKAAANESRAWLKSAEGVSTNKQSGAVMDPRAFFHLVRIGVDHIADDAGTLTDWLARMKADIGAKLFGQTEPSLEDVYEAAKLQHEANGGGDPVAKAKKELTDDLTHANVYNIARAHITAGVKGEAAVMKATHETLKEKHPELTERDVRRLFADYGRARFPSKDADAREARRLKTLVRLQESIDRLREGKPALRTGQQRDKADADIRAKQRLLNDLLKQAEAETGPSPARLATYQQARASNLRNQIEDLNREIETGEKKARTPAPADNTEVAALRAERDRLKAELKRIDEANNQPLTEEQKYQKRRQSQLQKMLDDTQARIAAGDYSRKVKPEPRELTEENNKLHYRVQEAKAVIARRQLAEDAASKPALKKIFGMAGETVNAARSVMLSFDDSFLLNQGGLYVAARPWKIPGLVAKGMRSFFSPEYAASTERDIKKRENYGLYVKSGLPLVGEASPRVANQDEAYNSRWLEKFMAPEMAKAHPVAAAGMKARNILTKPLRASQRAYNATANQIRADWFDAIHNSAANGNAMTKAELQDIAKIVSVMTGRSSIKDVQQAAGLMSKLFLAWHWTASRFQTVAGTPIWQAQPRMKKYMAMEYARVMTNLAALQGLLYFGAMIYSADHDDDDEEKPITDFDPRSGNFMKYRFGDTWVGLSAGIGPTLAFLSRMITGETVSKGKVVPLRKKNTLTQLIDWSNDRPIVEKKPNAFHSVPNVWLDWYHSRSSPAANYVLSASRGTNAAKQEFDPARDALGMVTPINFDDVYDILKSNGPTAGPAMLAWRFFGGNTDFRDPDMKLGEREPLPWDTTDKERP